jgi:hypothetical protein
MKYTQAQLEEAFKKVQNKEHWKNPINAHIPTSELEITRAAILHFTATDMIVGKTNNGLTRVWAKGYRLGPAGDH